MVSLDIKELCTTDHPQHICKIYNRDCSIKISNLWLKTVKISVENMNVNLSIESQNPEMIHNSTNQNMKLEGEGLFCESKIELEGNVLVKEYVYEIFSSCQM